MSPAWLSRCWMPVFMWPGSRQISHRKTLTVGLVSPAPQVRSGGSKLTSTARAVNDTRTRRNSSTARSTTWITGRAPFATDCSSRGKQTPGSDSLDSVAARRPRPAVAPPAPPPPPSPAPPVWSALADVLLQRAALVVRVVRDRAPDPLVGLKVDEDDLYHLLCELPGLERRDPVVAAEVERSLE